MEESQNTSQPQPVVKEVEREGVKTGKKERKGKKKSFLTVFIVILILALLGGGAWYILSSPKKSEGTIPSGGGLRAPQDSVDNSQPSPTPTPTPIDINKSEVKIELLNGTGIPGEASLVQSELEELGYDNIEVGNADDQDNDETVVTFSSELPQGFIEEFIGQMEEIYVKVSSSTSSSLEDFDIRVVAGLRSSYTPAPTKAPEPTATPTPETTGTLTPTPTISPTPTP
jgi:hypothetical protein